MTEFRTKVGCQHRKRAENRRNKEADKCNIRTKGVDYETQYTTQSQANDPHCQRTTSQLAYRQCRDSQPGISRFTHASDINYHHDLDFQFELPNASGLGRLRWQLRPVIFKPARFGSFHTGWAIFPSRPNGISGSPFYWQSWSQRDRLSILWRMSTPSNG